MDFVLSEELQMVRDAARDFAAQHVAPGAAERDLTEEFPIEPFRMRLQSARLNPDS